MTVQDVLLPDEKVLSECKPFYATSRRIIRLDEGSHGGSLAELTYTQVTAVGLVRNPSYPVMIAGVMVLLCAVFVTFIGFIFFTSILAVGGGAALLLSGSRGKPAFYQLHVQKLPTLAPSRPGSEWQTTINTFKGWLGMGADEGDSKWRLDYRKGGSFITTVRLVKGTLPEV